MEEFTLIPKRRMENAPSICKGHKETIIHFVDSNENRRYIVEVILNKGCYYIETPCTWTPSLDMDTLDGNLAQDGEEWILVQELNYEPKRLPVLFGDKDKTYFNDYLKLVGLPHSAQESNGVQVSLKADKKKWWKIW